MSRTASKLHEDYSKSFTLGSSVYGPWSLSSLSVDSQELEVRAAQVYTWEAGILESKNRTIQPKPVLQADASGIVKRSIIKDAQETTEKLSEVFVRPHWSNKVEYIIAQVGYSLKPLHLWHFPFLWLHHGNGIFFIIYILMMFLIGVPLLFLEMATGQKLQQGPIVAWKATSIWIGGLGYSSFMLCFLASLCMNMINVWTLFYLSQSFQYPRPWEQCPLVMNSSEFDPECARMTPSMYFWYLLTLKASDKIDIDGLPHISLILPLSVACFLLGASMCNGLKLLGKVMNLLVILSYLIIFFFFIWTLLLEGVTFGLQNMVVGKVSTVFNVTVWWEAGNQVLYALGLGFGSVVSMSSHIPQTNNCLKDVIIVVLLNIFTLLLYTAFVFSVMGFWATIITHRCFEKNAELLMDLVTRGKLPPEAKPPPNLNENPMDIFTSWLHRLSEPTRTRVLSHLTECSREKQFLKIKEGSRFAFQVFIETMSFIPGHVHLSIVFFVLLLCLGLSSMMGTMQGLIVPLQDSFAFSRNHPKLFIGLLTMVMFLFGIFFIRPSGLYYVRLLINFWIPIPVVIFTVLEDVAVAWLYGSRRFLQEFACMCDSPISPIYHWLWTWLMPVLLLIQFVITVIQRSTPITYIAWDPKTSEEKLQELPPFWKTLQSLVLFLIISPIPTHFVHLLARKIFCSSKNQVMPWTSPEGLSQSAPGDESVKEEEASGAEAVKEESTVLPDS
ncbi:orphan sodium- and chloride-dependent neurotransmitter transporter NTT5 [Suncus etruscus]|uniref:orphan sodium- and chloride-dependent neurotransmitter transporter NTT5 n=1 Tax=Suncus etruscus TaxID=109475 RepID=UPI002110395B|nr:orphan sodium- and chloride-dependent neurotransmitter transporter NTT5 [Suncus etruscus]